MPSPPTTDRLLAGRYRVLDRLGSGGMATVYLAADEHLGRRVAIKRLHADTPVDVARRFHREARLLASLSHPNVVAIFDTVADDEGVLIVMEHVAGETLRDALRRGPLERERAVEVVAGIAAALDHAHARGVVHRDVKPGNVLLGEQGAVKLADLGIARATEGTQITRSGAVLGTPSYMAPEQVEGGPVLPAVDVYALGAVAYELLTGRRARPGRTPVEVARRVVSEPPPDLREEWRDAPDAAAEALLRAMAREPAERQRSAGALADELATALGGRAATRPLPPAVASALAARSGETPPRGVPARGGEARPARRLRAGAGRRAAPVGALAAALAGALALALAAGGGEQPREAAEPAIPPAERQRAAGIDAARTDTNARAGVAREPERTAGRGQARAATARRGGGLEAGRRLNAEGFRLLQDGQAAAAVPVLQRAVAAFPRGSDDPHYAYALFNLGRALRLAGRPAEAIPVLERRLEIPNQTGVVRRELELARAQAAGAEPGAGDERPDGGRGKGKGRGRGNGRGGD